MEARTISRLDMVRTTLQFYNANKTELDTVPAFTTSIALVQTEYDGILALMQTVDFDVTIFAKVAAQKKGIMAEAAQKVASLTGAYAHSIRDMVLENAMKTRAYALEKDKKVNATTVCTEIYDKANAVKVPAANFGLTAGDLTALDDAIADYTDYMDKPRLSHGDKSSANKEIDVKLKTCQEILRNQLDRMIENWRTSNPTLVAGWKSARTIIDPPTKHTKLTVTVKNTSNGPIANATVRAAKKDLVKTLITNAAGMVEWDTIPFGKWSVTVSAPNYSDYKIEDVTVVKSEENTLRVVMTAIPT